MENEYRITISNKYSLFLNGDEDPMDKLQKLQLQAKTLTKKEKEKAKKNAGKSAEVTQINVLPIERNVEKVDQFSSPTAEELPIKPVVQTEGQSGSTVRNRGSSARDRPRGRGRPGPYQDTRKVGGGGDIFQGVEMYEQAGDRAGGHKDQGTSDRNNRPDGYRGGFRRYPPRYAAGQDINRDGFSDQRGSRYNQNNFQSQGDGGRPEGVRNFNRPSAAGEGTGFGYRPPRRGGFRGGRRMDRGGRYPSDSHPADGIASEDGANHPADRGGFEVRNARKFSGGQEEQHEHREHGDGEPMEHSDGQENGFAVRRGSRGRRGRGRGYGGGYDRAAPRYRDYGEQRARHSETRTDPADITGHDNTIQQAAEENKSPDEKPTAGMDSASTPAGEDGATWAEQLEAADKADQNSAKHDDETPVTPGAEESHEMTLDEWKAQRDAKRTKVDFNIRKPGEGEAGDPRWNKMYVLSKKETEKTEGVEEVEEEQEDDHHGTKPRNTLPIEIRFVDDSRRGGRDGGSFTHAGPRGGRGRGGGGFDRLRSSDDYYQRDSQQAGTGPGRGDYRDNRRPFIRGGRGGSGGGIRRERTPNLDNEMDFPSLDKTTGNIQPSQQ